MSQENAPRPEAAATDVLPGAASGFAIALAIASVATAIVVVLKEESPHGVMPWMSRLTGHHWTTHSLFALVVFFGLGTAISRLNGGRGPRISGRGVAKVLMAGVLVSAAIIAGFYLVAD